MILSINFDFYKTICSSSPFIFWVYRFVCKATILTYVLLQLFSWSSKKNLVNLYLVEKMKVHKCFNNKWQKEIETQKFHHIGYPASRLHTKLVGSTNVFTIQIISQKIRFIKCVKPVYSKMRKMKKNLIYLKDNFFVNGKFGNDVSKK